MVMSELRKIDMYKYGRGCSCHKERKWIFYLNLNVFFTISPEGLYHGVTPARDVAWVELWSSQGMDLISYIYLTLINVNEMDSRDEINVY